MTIQAPAVHLKRQILREAVRENLDTIAGRPPRIRSRSLRAHPWVWAAMAAVIPVALFISVNAISLGRVQPADVVVVGTRAPSDPPRPSNPFSLLAPKGMQPSLFRLAVKSIVLDPGHGGHDPGAQTAFGLSEKEITLDIGLRLRRLLEGEQYQVSMTREGDTGPSLRDRVLFANVKRADLFVSIHVNSMPLKDKHAVETYYLGPTSDPHVEQLAGDENRQSGYSLADFRRLLEGVYTDVRQAESKRFAEMVQAGLVAGLKTRNPRLENRGVRSAPFVVLIATEMPGILAEVSCISNEEDARRLADPQYRQAIAVALLEGVKTYAGARNEGL